MRAVAQKSQPIAQPTWDDRQPAARSGRSPGISTASIVAPSRQRSSSLTVPSADAARRTSSAAGVKVASNQSASPAGGRYPDRGNEGPGP